jgi:hypothetical protein
MIHFTYGSRGLAAYRWRARAATLGLDHPATRAALGRLNYYRGMTPQKRAVEPEAIAWYRESGAQPGYWNRSRRRAAAARSPSP